MGSLQEDELLGRGWLILYVCTLHVNSLYCQYVFILRYAGMMWWAACMKRATVYL